MKTPPCLNPYRAVIFRGQRDHQFFFHLVAKNGKIIAGSEGYKRKAACLKTACLICNGSPEPIRDFTVSSPFNAP